MGRPHELLAGVSECHWAAWTQRDCRDVRADGFDRFGRFDGFSSFDGFDEFSGFESFLTNPPNLKNCRTGVSPLDRLTGRRYDAEQCLPCLESPPIRTSPSTRRWRGCWLITNRAP